MPCPMRIKLRVFMPARRSVSLDMHQSSPPCEGGDKGEGIFHSIDDPLWSPFKRGTNLEAAA